MLFINREVLRKKVALEKQRRPISRSQVLAGNAGLAEYAGEKQAPKKLVLSVTTAKTEFRLGEEMA